MDLPATCNFLLDHWLSVGFTCTVGYLVASAVYNLYFHPLAKFPGPFFAKISAVPNFYHSLTGLRHVWIWQCHQLYGDAFRYRPNSIYYNSPTAYQAIYGTKANVRKAKFYEIWPRNSDFNNTLNTTDPGIHARKRKVLNGAFSEKAVRSAESFVTRHVDRWCDLLLEDNDGTEWTKDVNMSEVTDHPTFDIMGDLAFGKSLDIKEPGENPFREMPHIIATYLKFMYPISQSPLLHTWVWLKPRGLDALVDFCLPAKVKSYYEFLETSVKSRQIEEEESEKKELDGDETRKDMFHYLFSQKDDLGQPAYSPDELHAEANLLVIAGFDTVSVTLCGFWFYIIRQPSCYDKLVKEVRTTFPSLDNIRGGSLLSSCTYLVACINESLRLAPAGGSGLDRVVQAGGLKVDGEYIPEGIEVGVAGWAIMHREESFGDPWAFRPERWIVDAKNGVTLEDVARASAAFNPFSIGHGNCVGQKLAMVELQITIARVLYRMDVRRLRGDSLGGGAPEMGWGMRSPDQFQIQDAYVSQRTGPRVQFKKRIV